MSQNYFFGNLEPLFSSYFSMCLAASVVMPAVMVLRLVLGRLPKKYLCILWLLVIFRLLCPMELLPTGPLPSSASTAAADNPTGDAVVLPAASQTHPVHITGQPADTTPDLAPDTLPDATPDFAPGTLPDATPDFAPDTLPDATPDTVSGRPAMPDVAASNGPGISLSLYSILGMVSFIGTLVFLCLFLAQYLRLVRILKLAVPCGLTNPDGSAPIWTCEGITTPMVFGIFPPRIYVPSDFAAATCPPEQRLILRHESAHIRRLDYLLKPLSCVALSLHWWNPLAWCSVLWLQKDMEMACDEAVIAGSERADRKSYAFALLHYSVRNSGLSLPLTFGESSTESRVKNILSFHKRPFWVCLPAIALIAAVVVCLGTKPHDRQPENLDGISDRTLDHNLTDAAYIGELSYDFDASPIFMFPSFDTLKARYLLYWQEQLDTGAQVFVLEPRVAMEHYTQEENWNKDFSLYLRYCTFDERFIPTLYVTNIACVVEDMSVYAADILSNTAYDHIGDYSAADSLTFLPYEEQQPWPFRITGGPIRLSSCISDHALLSSSHMYDFLRDPLTALPSLLHLENGVCAHIADNEEGCYVSYTFDSQPKHPLTYFMYQEKGFWFPGRLVLDDETSHEQDVYEYITTVTAEELRAIQKTPEDYGADDLLTISNSFVLLSRAASQDVALYGLFGGEAMVLRDGNTVYPLYHPWEVRMKTQVYRQDFDMDGVWEYGILEEQKEYFSTHTGAISSIDWFYILEPTGNTLQMYSAPLDNQSLSDRLHYTWREPEQTISFFLAGDTALDISPRELGSFYWPHHADTIYSTYAVDHYDDSCVFFVLYDGRLWRKTTSYATLWNVAVQGEITIMEELLYEGNGRFSYGEAALSLPSE